MSATTHPVPAWRVTLDGRDLTERMRPRLVSLALTECRGEEADQLDLELHDHDGLLALPSRGAVLEVAIGWRHSGLVSKGTFRVDEVEHGGPPDIVSLRARSADMSEALKARRERSWDATTLGELLGSIAGEHGLTPHVAATLAGIAVPHLDQTESDLALLTRLGKQHDAVATIKAGRLIFAPIGAGVTASGAPLPSLAIARSEGDSHRYALTDRDTYSGVRAYWHDQAGANRRSVLVGQSGSAKRLRDSFATEADARAAAQAEWQRIQRGAATLSLSLARGRADVSPEQRVRAAGFKADIDATDWLVVRVSHRIDGSGGFGTSLELEEA